MTEAERLREQAERCLRLAKATTDRELAENLTTLAAEYLDSAQTLERLAAAQSPPPVNAGQRPVQQQQQTQREPGDDENKA
jgi:hypothetical protein